VSPKPPPTAICPWCRVPFSEHHCGYPNPELGTVDWDKVTKVFGDQGLPSCGLTDARRLGTTGDESGTTYLGPSSKESRRH
jgi:hypothetical protein